MILDVPKWASEYVGIPYEMGGRSRDGVDCYGLVFLILRYVFRLPAPGYPEFTVHKGSRERIEAFRQVLDTPVWISAGEEPKVGNVVVFRVQNLPLHCGLVIGPDSMIHSERGVNTAIDRLKGVRWRHRIQGYYQLAAR